MAHPPHLDIDPIRRAAQPPRLWQTLPPFLVVSPLLLLGLIRILSLPAPRTDRPYREGQTVRLVLAETGGGSSPRPRGPAPARSESVLRAFQPSAPVPLPELASPRDLDLSSRVLEALPAPGPAGTEGGSGTGSGTGPGSGSGPGRGTGRSHGLLSSARSDGAVDTVMADMAIEHQEVPDYPALARDARQTGDVLVELTIDEQGVPIKWEVVELAFPVFLQPVLKVLPLWRFKPVRVQGQRLKAVFRLTFRFTLT